MDAENHPVHGQIKRKPADLTHIFSVSTIDTMPFLARICLTYIGLTLERFCGIWVFYFKKYTTFNYMMLGSFM